MEWSRGIACKDYRKEEGNEKERIHKKRQHCMVRK